MRPESLELEGFTAFREHTRIEFGDADLFAFTGPTGAGKSSLIDAMIFALYGKVPRLGEKLVEPVISKGKQQARVRLDFALGGERYTAARVVRRTKSGATTKEATLERGGEVLARNAPELDSRVGELIGLDFQQFTTCVALPQGEFARFLQQRPADRQHLLSQLLGLKIYTQIRQVAYGHRVDAEAEVKVCDGMLGKLDEIGEADEAVAEARVAALDGLQSRTEKELARAEDLRRKREEAEFQQERRGRQVQVLDAAKTPSDARQLGAVRKQAEGALREARHARGQAEKALAQEQESRESLGDHAEHARRQARWSRQARLAGELEAAERSVEETRTEHRKEEASLDEAESNAAAAREALERAECAHRAHALQGGLVVGEPCPVCEQKVARLPTGGETTALDALRAVLRKAERTTDAARKQRDEVKTAADGAERERQIKGREHAEVEAELVDEPDRERTELAIAAIAKADGAVEEAERRAIAERRAVEAAQREVDGLSDRESAAWTAYDGVRDSVAELEPPAPDRGDLLGSWTALETWAAAKRPELTAAAKALAEQTRRLAGEEEKARDRLAAAFSEAGVEFADDPRQQVGDALSKARDALKEVQRILEERRKWNAQKKAAAERGEVAGALENHLRANRFERWLLTAAFRSLAADASKILRELSNEQYSFEHNDRFEFDIVDHANADETRSAKTLSGGETFLASLSLALALSEQVAELATEGAARLESIFLDEGFGSLDADTLDTVATTIEELGAKRTVGIVTHVRDLAERIPVQFRVSKTSATAVVERLVS